VRRPAVVALVASLAACGAQERGVVNGRPDDPIVAISEGACPTNTCPVYDLTLRPGGAYILNGEAFVKIPGVTAGELGEDAWTGAQRVLEDAGFWALPPDQTSRTLDACHAETPTVRVTWRLADGKQKTIAYEAGCDRRKTAELIAKLRETMGFNQLVWTDERFRFEGPAPR
jgi:hypothetical protein